jgi:beta-glucosidase
MAASDPPAQRARKLLSAMNMTEKLHMLKGNNTMKPYVGGVAGNARLGIPDLTLNDGPQGFRDNDGHKGSSTQVSSLTVSLSSDIKQSLPPKHLSCSSPLV